MSSVPNLNGSLGATEIGSVLGAFLFGIMTLQTYNYYRSFPGDSILLKFTVALVWFLELGHTISAWHALYSQTVIFYAQPEYISSPPHSEEITILFASLIYMVVQDKLTQTFFSNRVRVLSGRWYTMVVACFINTLRFISNMGALGLLFYHSRVSILLEYRWLVSSSLGLGIVVDLLITASMCYFLQKMRSSENQRTRTIVETLILWSIETTLLTRSGIWLNLQRLQLLIRASATSVIQIILFMTRNDLIWTTFYIIQAKLFSNSMVASSQFRFRIASPEWP
ncbi:hypothetical protein C8R43DRAFT_1111187 [Mycena crocata]|nr:hypothetical protein C8R43DRAFT_1111187 [Mycena crocata]